MRKILFFLLCFPLIALAGVHKCVNDGKVVYSESPCVSGAVVYDAERFSVADGSVRSVLISRGVGGLFWAVGSVNGLPVDFVVDTGATSTTLSGDVAYRLGVRSCVPVGQVVTANGSTSFCRVNVSSLIVAGFNFFNVSVVVNPTMQGASLFGNDLLKRFTVISRDGVMMLSR